jgi:RimJ/RimL family protein N-acetyltransferase
VITTRFIAVDEYPQYANWIKKQDLEARNIYFGVNFPDSAIDTLVEKFVADADKHHFLVAEYKGEWIGTIHICEVTSEEVEFGFMVGPDHRGHGIADKLMTEAITWCRNRGYNSVFMHCLTRNAPIKHLCRKHGMILESEHGETETKLPLPPADFSSVTQEIITKNRNVYRIMLQNMVPFWNEVYS